MLVVLSPAKTIRTDISVRGDFTIPEFLEKSEKLISSLKRLNIEQLSSLMQISPKLAQLNFERFQQWTLPFTSENARQTIFSFKGEVFNGLDAESLSREEVAFAQGHLVILSGLYGVLRPLDLIMPYRLEMGTKASVAGSKNLYAFWKRSITLSLRAMLDKQHDNVLVNLASNEYFKSIDIKNLNAKVITPVFKESRGGGFKMVTVYAKKARGLMTRYILENRPETPDELKLFDAGGYYYNESMSSENNFVFTR